MRPVRLVMSAFGSYAGEEILDFGKMDRGIFLVTGDTGSRAIPAPERQQFLTPSYMPFTTGQAEAYGTEI